MNNIIKVFGELKQLSFFFIPNARFRQISEAHF